MRLIRQKLFAVKVSSQDYEVVFNKLLENYKPKGVNYNSPEVKKFISSLQRDLSMQKLISGGNINAAAVLRNSKGYRPSI